MLFGAADGDPCTLFLDGNLRDPGLLDDADDLANALGSRLVDSTAEQRVLAARPVSDRPQQRLGLLAEEREQEKLLFAGGQAGGLVRIASRSAAGSSSLTPSETSETARCTVGSISPGGVPKRPSRSARNSSTTVW